MKKIMTNIELIQIRKTMRLTQAEMAKRIGCSRSQIGNMEYDIVPIQEITANAIRWIKHVSLQQENLKQAVLDQKESISDRIKQATALKRKKMNERKAITRKDVERMIK